METVTSYSCDAFDSIHRILSENARNAELQKRIAVMDDLWSGVLESHAAKVASAFQRANAYKEFQKALGDPKSLECIETQVVFLPYLFVVWQEIKRDANSFYQSTFRNSHVDTDAKKSALEFHDSMCGLQVRDIIETAAGQWAVGESLVVDVSLLYCIWTASELGVYFNDAVYANVLACCNPALPFMVVFLACLCLQDSHVHQGADESAKGEFPWGGYFTSMEFLENWSTMQSTMKGVGP